MPEINLKRILDILEKESPTLERNPQINANNTWYMKSLRAAAQILFRPEEHVEVLLEWEEFPYYLLPPHAGMYRLLEKAFKAMGDSLQKISYIPSVEASFLQSPQGTILNGHLSSNATFELGGPSRALDPALPSDPPLPAHLSDRTSSSHSPMSIGRDLLSLSDPTNLLHSS